MIKNLLLSACMASAMTFAADAQQVNLQSMASLEKPVSLQQEKSALSVKLLNGRVLESKQVAKGLMLQKVQTADGLIIKRLAGANANTKIDPKSVKKGAPSRETSDDVTLDEGFEGWDGATEGWLPDGWSIQSNTGEIQTNTPINWTVGDAVLYMPTPIDNYYAISYYDDETKDEWLISPVVDVPDSPKLYYKAYVAPAFLFQLTDETVDWDSYEFIEKKMAANVQVLVRAEGEEEWTVVKDYFEEYNNLNLSLYDLFNLEPTDLEPFAIDLTEFKAVYKDKRIQVAFRYYGADGNTVLLDNISVSNPSLEASYSWPLGTQFFGLSSDWVAYPKSITVNPVNVPLTWSNTTEDYTADFTWEYDDPITAERMTVNTTDLTLTYVPDYSSDFSCRNNVFFTPKLIATAAGSAPGHAQSYDYCQFGGKAEWDQSGNLFNFGLSPFNWTSEGFNIMVVDDFWKERQKIEDRIYEQQDYSIPIFGYNQYVDQYWTYYTFQGDEGEGDGVKMTGILNYYYTHEAPIVISGAWIHAEGQIGADAEFTLDIIPLDDDSGEMRTPIATATCKGSDMIMDEGDMRDYYTIPFTFAEPVVLSQMDCESYVVRLSGFNDPDNVTWFAPYQSVLDNPDGYALGWIQKDITFNGETTTSLSAVATYTGLQSFDIVLDAAYPWLDCETSEVAISGSDESVVELGSYYDGSEFAVTLADGTALPEWLSVTADGRYGNTKAYFAATGSTAAECDVKIAAPGVAKVFHVSYDGTSAVNGINAAGNTTITEAFDAMGRPVAIDSDAKGIYLLRNSDGSVKKIIR